VVRALGIVSELWIYPVKALGGVSCTQLILEPEGPKWDRRFMLVDDAGKFVTQRALPKLVCVCCSFRGPNLVLQFEKSEFFVPLEDQNCVPFEYQNEIVLSQSSKARGYEPETKLCRVWKDEVVAWVVPGSRSWFQSHFGVPLTLVQLNSEAPRIRTASAYPKSPFSVSFGGVVFATFERATFSTYFSGEHRT
jgi:uncharacterized protein